ncbi:mycothiol system anti-sigma-R factor [Leekyejoonella antrihumi]|uniref:Mycothiol system anti-sigma-R factor n=1 Tax=Leekyejoonella antrihumi TaxID=1660198 RepID=A0A563DYQ2_9MICO|nr:mycothiol system anti-sigma-R factor [Leekyejoonella antrihumi]TWP35259.1 mycothiol system anti-sigma-R factor [Leekyejoonella antrihumi]
MTNAEHSGCDDYVAHLYEYIDGELSAQECAALKAHLQDCPPCLDEYERDALLKTLIRRSCACEQAPAMLRTQILTQITTVTVTRVEFGEG